MPTQHRVPLPPSHPLTSNVVIWANMMCRSIFFIAGSVTQTYIPFAVNGLAPNIHVYLATAEPLSLSVGSLIYGRRSLSGSLIGGIKETQEMLDFCGEHNVTADIELIPIQKINEAYDRLVKSDVKYRFVIDMASLKQAA
jgi:D-arabinose 1-dehydrogenase-like Zn-dependent alcohol dehydrogenase